MSWFERPITAHERAEFSRLRELYLLLKHWNGLIPELSWIPQPALEIEELGQAIGAETADELLTRVKLGLRKNFEEWREFFETPVEKRAAAFNRALRLTEDEAVRYTGVQWPGVSHSSFNSIAALFAAYRETPFFTLYRDSLLLISNRKHRLEFILDHPAYEMETAWMRGFAQVLRPNTIIESHVENAKKIYEWRD